MMNGFVQNLVEVLICRAFGRRFETRSKLYALMKRRCWLRNYPNLFSSSREQTRHRIGQCFSASQLSVANDNNRELNDANES